jgi:uracil-DNA glycosylase family 4
MNKHKYCEGCKVLKTKRAFHSHEDYVSLSQVDVLFVSESFRLDYGRPSAFSGDEKELLRATIDMIGMDCSIGYTAAVKCPYIKKQEMKATDMNLCRSHLSDTIKATNPKLIIACGNLAFNMFTRKSGINKYRGELFESRLDYKHGIIVPVFHPFAVVKDNSKFPLFKLDIENAYKQVIKGEVYEEIVLEYDYITEVRHLKKHEVLFDYEGVTSCDLEATGLDFKKDKILTIAFSYDYGEEKRDFVIPMDHKDSPFLGKNEEILSFLKRVFSNEKNTFIFHNAKFDLKMLFAYDLEPKNVVCTKIMAKVVNENRPNNLRDLVKEYFGRVF